MARSKAQKAERRAMAQCQAQRERLSEIVGQTFRAADGSVSDRLPKNGVRKAPKGTGGRGKVLAGIQREMQAFSPKVTPKYAKGKPGTRANKAFREYVRVDNEVQDIAFRANVWREVNKFKYGE